MTPIDSTELKAARARIAELNKAEGDMLVRAQRAERQFAEMESANVELEEAAAHRELELAEMRLELAEMRMAFIQEPGSKAVIAKLTEQLEDQRRVAHVYQTERDAARVDNVAILGALEEWGRWPDMPDVPYGCTYYDNGTGVTKELVLHPDQIKGLSRAIMVQVQKMRESGWGMSAIKSHYAHDGLLDALRKEKLERKKLWRAILCDCQEHCSGPSINVEDGDDCRRNAARDTLRGR